MTNIQIYTGNRSADNFRTGSDTVKLDEFLYTRGFLEGTCSDITIVAFGTQYRLHRLILDRSPFFSSCFNGGWAESTSSEISLSPETSDPNIVQHAFEIALARLYGHVDREREDANALPLLAAASYLELQDLAESCVRSLVGNLKTSNISSIVKFITSSYYGPLTDRLLESAKALLYRDGWEMDFSEWDGISGEIAAEIAGYEGFYVPTEYSRYCFVKDLIDWRIRHAYEIEAQARVDDMSMGDICQSVVEEEADIKPLQDLLETGIYYVHMSFEELQKIIEDKDMLGRPVVSENTIRDALWQQIILRQRVLNAPYDNAELGVTNTEIVQSSIIVNGAKTPDRTLTPGTSTPRPGEKSSMPGTPSLLRAETRLVNNSEPRRYYIPTEDSTTVIGDCPEQPPQVIVSQRGLPRSSAAAATTAATSDSTTSNTPSTTLPSSEAKESDGASTGDELRYSNFPPFRFSAEFKSVRTLKERKRVYSKTVFYAGSYWNIYIQKVKSTKNVQLGVYLHRAKDREGSSSSANPREHTDNVTTQIGLLDLGASERHNGDDNTAASDLTVSSLHPTDESIFLSSTRQGANTSASRTLASTAAAPAEAANPALAHYVDCRPMIQTYFKIFSPSRKGKMLSMFSSGPDSFNFSQSWGWKSSSLILEEALIGQNAGTSGQEGKVSGAGDADKDAKLRFMVVLGMLSSVGLRVR